MNLKLKTIREIRSLCGKRVFLRTDFNVPLSKRGDIHDDRRIRSSLPTIQYLKARGAKILIGTHLGRPEGKVVSTLRLVKIARVLSRLLHHKVHYQQKDIFSSAVMQETVALKEGEIFLFENFRFLPDEEANGKRLSKRLALFADLYVNDAFAANHRQHASLVGLPRLLPSFAGFALRDEVRALRKVCERRAHPAVAVIGGRKVVSKSSVLALLLKKFDMVLLGGGVANTALVAQGYEMGRSLFDRSIVSSLRRVVQKKNLLLPHDVFLSSKSHGEGAHYAVSVECVPKRGYALDIGPKTLERYQSILKQARTIVLVGPMGCYEIPAFASGTRGVIHTIAQSSAYSVVGGGDTLDAVKRFDAERHISYISNGGGSLLQFVSGVMLPGIQPLLKK